MAPSTRAHRHLPSSSLSLLFSATRSHQLTSETTSQGPGQVSLSNSALLHLFTQAFRRAAPRPTWPSRFDSHLCLLDPCILQAARRLAVSVASRSSSHALQPHLATIPTSSSPSPPALQPSLRPSSSHLPSPTASLPSSPSTSGSLSSSLLRPGPGPAPLQQHFLVPARPSTPISLRLASCNVNGLRGKRDLIAATLDSHQLHAMLLQESKLCSAVPIEDTWLAMLRLIVPKMKDFSLPSGSPQLRNDLFTNSFAET